MRLIVTAYRGVSLLSRAIRWQTWSVYSHVGLGRVAVDRPLSETLRQFAAAGETIEAWDPGGVRYGATGPCRHHTPGTRIDCFVVPGLGADASRQAWEFASGQVGKRYDYRGLVRFLKRSKPRQDDRWFCSELVFAALAAGGLHALERIDPSQVSPGLLIASPVFLYAGSLQWPDGWDEPVLYADPEMDSSGFAIETVCGRYSLGPMHDTVPPAAPRSCPSAADSPAAGGLLNLDTWGVP